MIYPDAKGVALMGAHGFIGKALSKKNLPPGVYFFNSPSSNVLFDQNLDYCMEQTINDFLKVLQYCRDHKALLIYPSSATVYNKNTAYARCKAVIEELAQAYAIPSIGLRIAAGYGPGESHKGKYASVIYQWCKQMKQGQTPVIYGDGTQTRDFIFEDDIASNIADLAWLGKPGIYDIGTGINTSFNEVIVLINKILGTNIKPVYMDRPKNYVEETRVSLVPTKWRLENGIKKLLEQ